MSILQRLRSDLQKSVAEHQAMLLASVLRQRFAELTLGDLREILTSPLGRGIDNLKIADLSQGVVGGGASEAPAASPRRTKKRSKAAPKPAPAKKGAKKGGPAKAEPPAKKGAKKGAAKKSAKRARVTSRDFVVAVYEALRAANGALTSGELRAKLGGSSSTVYRAVTELIKGGKLRSEGKPARYSVIDGASAPAPAASPAEGAVAAARRGKKEEVSARTLEGRAQYHAMVLAVLKQANDWVGASHLRAQVGGSDNQIRIALHRLMESGQVTRRGERNSTEYKVTSR